MIYCSGKYIVLKIAESDSFVKIQLSNFLGNEFLVKCINFNKITLPKSIPFQRQCISEVNKLFFVVRNKYKC